MSAAIERVPDRRCRARSTLRAALSVTALIIAALAGCGDGSSEPMQGPTGGTVEVSAVTTGDTLDTDGYEVTLDGTDSRMLSPDGAVSFEDVTAGSHEVEISGIQVNCGTSNTAMRSVTVTAGDVTAVHFDVSCRPALLDRILFTSYRGDGDADLYTMARDGSQQERLMDTPDRESNPGVSPDGTRVLFGGEDGSLEVLVLEVGGAVTNLTNDPDRDIHPAWSPDGSRIAFSSDRAGDLEIWSMNADGTGAERLTDDPGTDWSPAWSPDGEKIAFTSERTGNWDVFVMDADGSNVTRVTSSPATDEFPAWGPGGDLIYFSSDRTGDYEVFSIRTDGTDATQLTEEAGWDGAVEVSPDGGRIAFTAERSGNGDVFSMDPDGSNVERLTDSDGFDGQPGWSPIR